MMTATIALVSPGEVKKHLSNAAPYTILDARPYSRYVAGHLPGAVWIGWDAWCEKAPVEASHTLAQTGYWGVLKESPKALLQEHLEQLGLYNNRPILVYADGPSSKGREARIAWMLLYWGASSVSLLNGGWSAWLRSDGYSDVAIPQPGYGQFEIRVQEHRRVQLYQLKQDYQRNALPLLIDARSRAEFAGHHHAYQPRMGRLPGAVHIPYTELFDDQGYFIRNSVYLQRLRQKTWGADHQLVAYCEVGVRSCLFALLHEIYTGQVIANFDGSVMEWALDMELPMERDVQEETL
ncbi:MAG: sulfurtransferase [Ktedonobacteraceae bacterium]